MKDQYADASNVTARGSLHARFSTNPYGWPRWVFDHFDFPETYRVLELGCGPGWLWEANRDRIPPGWDVTLSDSSAGMLSDTERRLGGAGRPFSFVLIDAQAIPFDDAGFDAVIANHMLYHVPDLDRAVRGIRRVLAPAGCLYASTNGAAHMRELRELVGLFAPNLPFARGANHVFSLENGAEHLRRHFRHVNLSRYDDALVVPEPKPLLDYLLSMGSARPALTGRTLDELTRRITDRIAADGAIRITKDAGMFVATGWAPRKP